MFSDDTSFRLLWLVCSFKHQLNYQIWFIAMIQIKLITVKNGMCAPFSTRFIQISQRYHCIIYFRLRSLLVNLKFFKIVSKIVSARLILWATINKSETQNTHLKTYFKGFTVTGTCTTYMPVMVTMLQRTLWTEAMCLTQHN